LGLDTPVRGRQVATALESEWKKPIGYKPTGRTAVGYLDAKGLHDSSREELVSLLASGRYAGRLLVWTPESTYLVTAAESPMLRAAFQEGLRRRAFRLKPRGAGPVALIVFGAVMLSLVSLTSIWNGDPNVPGLLTVAVLLMLVGFAGELLPRYRDYADSRLDADQLTAGESSASRHEAWIAHASTGDSYILVVILAIVYFAQAPWKEVSVTAAGFNAVAIRAGEWWRLFTAPLMHANYFHIAANAGAIVFAGLRIEAHLHRALMPLVFLVGALYGGFASLLVMDTDRPAIGASGGAIALVGFLLVFARRHRHRLPRDLTRSLVEGLVLTAIMGVVGYRIIGNAAHLGGLVVGGLMGMLAIPKEPNTAPGKVVIAAGIAAAGILIISAAGTVVTILRAAL
jgi:membrane associated rhomboid family serine protease